MNTNEAKEPANADPKGEAMDAAARLYKFMIDQPHHGPHTPMSRQLKQIIKNIFARPGLNAIADIERAALNAKKITPSIVGTRPAEASKKAIEMRRAQRVSIEQDSAPQVGNSNRATAKQERLARVHRRNLLQGTSAPVLEKKESVVEDKSTNAKNLTKAIVDGLATPRTATKPDAPAAPPQDTQAAPPAADATAKPLTATEAASIVDMGAQEIVQKFGEDRLRATMEKIEPGVEFKGSGRQIANRLKAKLTAK